jgi:hypothetical protein
MLRIEPPIAYRDMAAAARDQFFGSFKLKRKPLRASRVAGPLDVPRLPYAPEGRTWQRVAPRECMRCSGPRWHFKGIRLANASIQDATFLLDGRVSAPQDQGAPHSLVGARRST